MRRLADPSRDVRWQAAYALGELGDRRAVPPLVALQEDPDPEVRKLVASALRRLGARDGPPVPAPAPRAAHPPACTRTTTCSTSATAPSMATRAHRISGSRRRTSGCWPSPRRASSASARRATTGCPSSSTWNRPRRPTTISTRRDHVVEASLAVPSGRVMIDGCRSYYSAESPRIRGRARHVPGPRVLRRAGHVRRGPLPPRALAPVALRRAPYRQAAAGVPVAGSSCSRPEPHAKVNPPGKTMLEL